GLAAGWRLLVSARRAPRTSGLVLAGLGLLAGVATSARRCSTGGAPLTDAPKPIVQTGPRPGVLIGYSAVGGSGLRSDSMGLLEHLQRLGHRSIDPLSRRAFSAQTFARIASCVCTEFGDVP